MEIERRFLAPHPPELPVLRRLLVEQSYLTLLPEVRIRRCRSLGPDAGLLFDLTIKSQGGLVRQEIIKSLTEEEYAALLPMAGGPPIQKDYTALDLDGLVLECSVVDRDLPTRYSYAEIEFPTVEEARAFQPPDWLGREVTEDASFRMARYWARTRLRDR